MKKYILIFLLILASLPAYADSTICALNAASTLTGSECIPVMQGGLTKKTTPSALASFVGGVSTFSAGTTGFTPNSATNGAVTLAGTLAVANGGTGVTTSTGTTNVVLSASPTLTGTVTGASSNWSGNVGIGTTTPVVSLDLSQKTDSIAEPVGTTGQAPTAANGYIRYDTTLSNFRGVVNSVWTSLTTGVINYAYNLNQQLFPYTRAAFDNSISNTSHTKLLFLGESTTAGYRSSGSNYRYTSYPFSLARALALRGVPVSTQNIIGCGNNELPTSDTRVTFGSGWACGLDINSNGTLGGYFITMTSGAAGTFSFAMTAPTDTCTISYAGYSGAPTFSWNVDGGSNTNIISAQTTSLGISTITFALGTHTLNLKYVSGSFQGSFDWIDCWNSTTNEMSIANAGVGGATAAALASNALPWNGIGAIEGYAPNATFLNEYANDAANGTSIPSYKTSMNSLISAAQVSGDTFLITGVPMATGTASLATQQSYQQAQVAIAGTTIPVIDTFSLWWGYSTGEPTGNTQGWYYSDGVHQTYPGELELVSNILPYIPQSTSGIQEVVNATNGMVIGSSYVGTNVSPLNGAIIQGNVGIGTATPISAALSVNGDTAVTGYGQTIAVGTGTTTWMSPAYTTANTSFKVTAIGGGGNGAVASATTTFGGGGGSGGACIRYYTGLAPSTNYTIAVGAAGSNSTFSDGTTVLTAGGGGNGGTTGQGGTVGACTNQTYYAFAAPGETGPAVVGTAGSAGGDGGGNIYGRGGLGSTTTTGGSGLGCGGGGGGTKNGQTAGTGAIGCVLVEWIH